MECGRLAAAFRSWRETLVSTCIFADESKSGDKPTALHISAKA